MIRIVLIGGGGHASDVLGVIEDMNAAGGGGGSAITVAGFLDDREIDLTRFAGRSVRQIGGVGDLASIDASHFILAVGWPKTRASLAEAVGSTSLTAATLVHPSATVSAGVQLGQGVVVMAGAHLSPMSSVGHHACLSNHAIVGHDAVIGDYAGLMPGSVVSGGTVVSEGVLIGTNATVLEGVVLGAWSTLGAGGVALTNVAAGVVAVGTPARPITLD